MARQKATIMLDRAKAEQVRALSSSATISDGVEAALDRYLADEGLRNDVAAYLRAPLTAADLALLRVPVQLDLGDDDVDYDAIYGDPS
jgi:hypothetical protein